MPRHLQAALGLVLVGSALQIALPAGAAGAADTPTHSVTVTGEGVSTYPAYAPQVQRYAVRTTSGTAGTIDVTATTSDPDGAITVNGRPATSGEPLEVTGLAPGDEVAVAIDDAGGSSHQAFVYLPAGFPELAASGTRPADGAPYVFLGLGSFLSATSFQTAVDARGVPAYVREALEPHDFRPQPHGPAYTVFEPVKDSPDDQEYGYRVRELDRQFAVTRTRRLRPVPRLGITPDNTDFHDVQYAADGRVVMIGYHRDVRPHGRTWLDAVIEIVGPKGKLQFAWSTQGHVKPKEAYVLGAKGQDYAHINSVQLLRNGDLLASFRNLGQVMRIATTRHGGHRPGDVVWRMGGVENEFRFKDPGYAGFCAQHDARILPNGHLMLFDNGSRADSGGPIAPQTADMCPDPSDRDGARVARPQSRVVEYAVDARRRVVRRVWSYAVPGRYAPFAGNAQRLPGGHTLVGWSNAENNGPEPAPITSEVTRGGSEIWSLSARGWFSYRAFSGEAPDAIRPEIEVSGLDDGSPHPVGSTVVVDYTCSDRGGSVLVSCAGPVPSGTPWTVTGSPFVVTARDGQGNSTRSSTTY
ncbi:aryl-sulfate sulfotransferase [Nocardioides sp. KIGAM211]|uniref:Aryl-sulfate sulfotransferase n=1 Tax=Nocardioides luti TaxID=2761101 RepID=A0A7X0RDG5_9ACTN|nr:aryl-sulfate sulfotransferase [Nocardioides luti]MBB6626274.1 aryl-sulfate sulfotransferase [Nocardioides luti]